MLALHGLGSITSAKQAWWQNPNTFALLLEDAKSGEPLGGVRLQRWGNGQALPLEQALAFVDPQVHAWVACFADRGVAELCGLWCSPKLGGFQLGLVLTRMGLALAGQLRTHTLLALCDSAKAVNNCRLGFTRDRSLACRGTFEYPRPGLRAQVLKLSNTWRLSEATAENRSAISNYRDVPTGTERLSRGESWLELTRDLRLSPPENREQQHGWLAARAGQNTQQPKLPAPAPAASLCFERATPGVFQTAQ
ncbi:MAG TPA: hypothetical protein VFU02_08635 [Polyangiaceae bacterium]|nr:hypothetical protein [Polyangiaceae bacterium]